MTVDLLFGQLEALSGVLGLLPSSERQNRGRWQIVSELGVERHIDDDGRAGCSIKASTALAAAEQTSADTEWLDAGSIMHEAATLNSTDHEIARTTSYGPRLGWKRHQAALPRS